MSKVCSRCNGLCELSNFPRNAASPDGRYSICKPCTREIKAAYRKRPEVREREKERLRLSYAARKATLAVSRRARYEANKETELARNKAWADRNRERQRELSRRWAKENPLRSRALVAKRRAIKNAAPGTYTQADVLAMLERQACKCAACAAGLEGGFHVDHVIPLARGGSNWPSNLQLLCAPCNWSKGDKLPDEWRRAA